MTLFRQLLVVTLLALRAGASDDNGADYGVDCSWPVHSTDFSCGDLLGDRKKIYDEYMDDCREKWGKKGATRCDSNEQDRLEVNRRQPQGMVVRYDDWFLNYNGHFLHLIAHSKIINDASFIFILLELHIDRIQETQSSRATHEDS
jgi:hypothetical protein